MANKIIKIKDGKEGLKKYYLYSEYETYKEALEIGKITKMERKREFNVKYFILPIEDTLFGAFPTTKYLLYFSRKLTIL